MAKSAQLNVVVTTKGIKDAQKQLDALEKEALEAERAVNGVGSGASGMGKKVKSAIPQIKLMKGSLSQMSFQLQDVAVQAAMGTNNLIILGQQGPQILSLLGPLGAVLGVVVAVGAAALNMGTSFKNAGDEADFMKGKVEDLRDTQREYFELLAEQAIAEETIRMAELQEQLDKSSKSLETMTNRSEGVGRSAKDAGMRIDEMRLENAALADSVGAAETKIKVYTERLKELETGISDNSEEMAEFKQKYEDLRSELELNISLVDKSAREQAKLTAIAELGSEATKEQKQEIITLIDAYYDEVEAVKSLQASVAQEQKDREAAATAARKAAAEEQRLAENKKNTANRVSQSIIDSLLDEVEALEAKRDLVKQNQDAEIGDLALHGQALVALDQEIALKRAEIAKKEKEDKMKEQEDFFNASSTLAGSVSDSFSVISDAIAASGEEASTAYAAAFALSKGFATAQAALNLQLAVSQALALPADVTLAQKFSSYASVLSAATSVVSSISGISYSGRAQGGSTNPNGTYVVGERGPELVTFGRDGGSVTSNAQMQAQTPKKTNYTVVNQTSANIGELEEQRITENDVVLIMRETVPAEISNANSSTSKSLRRNTSASRRLR